MQDVEQHRPHGLHVQRGVDDLRDLGDRAQLGHAALESSIELEYLVLM